MCFLLRFQHQYFHISKNLGDERGVDQGYSATSLGGLNDSPLYNMPDIKFDALSDITGWSCPW